MQKVSSKWLYLQSVHNKSQHISAFVLENVHTVFASR